jgi:hypothetical protein
MSSAVLYLAIVAVWGVVLVPMWLRRDGDGIGRLLHRRGDTGVVAEDYEVADEPEPVGEPAGEPAGQRRRVSRGAVIARRRRRTLGLSLLTVTAVVVTAMGVAPWWFVAPPLILLMGHLSLLRVAVRVDQARREEARRAAARAAAAQRRREAARVREAAEAARVREAAARTAEIIELPDRPYEEVYDQYEDRRAVGD